MLQLGFNLPDRISGFTPEETIRFATLAEEAGFSSVWKGEHSDTNSFMVLTAIAERTESIHLGISIANVFSRSPTLIAMSANTLNELSDGRIVLGIGVSSKQIVENWHGLQFEHPLRRLRESIEIIRELFDEDTVDYNGKIFDVGPFSANYLDEGNKPPIYNAALGETNRKLTGEFADGWIPLFAPQSKLNEYASDIQKKADEAGRPTVSIVPWIPAAVDPDAQKAETRVRYLLAQELSVGYHRTFREFGFGESADDARELWLDGDRDAAMAAISDDILDEFTIYGTPESCREQVAEYHDIGVDELTVWPSFRADADEVERFIREFGEYIE